MAFGFGRDMGPRENPFVQSPRPPSPQFSTPSFPDSSAAPRFPSPRAFEAVGRSPSSVATSHLAPGSSQLYNASNGTFERGRRSPSPVATSHLSPGSAQPFAASNRNSSMRWGDRHNTVTGGLGNFGQRGSSPHYPGTGLSSKGLPSQDAESSRRSPVQYTDDFLNEPINDATGGHADSTFNRNVASEQRQSPFSAVTSNHPIIRPTALNNSQRPSSSPPKSSSRFNGASDSQYNQRVSSSTDGANGNASVTRLPSQSLTKRTRSPPAATGQAVLKSSPFAEDESEREEQAKAKRLARFKTELDEVEPSSFVQRGSNPTQNKKNSLMKSVENRNSMEGLSQEDDNEDLQSSSIIVGLCPDMCPESERGERERKGDLDRYERLDGDRNHTNKILAVKKYNRTAEREAELIRPMPILQKTMDYLLGLLDQPYDDRLLGLYNFLWDRMRAIRMDLRMQHIFNLKAITMLEQMIRLHVLVMHELCEFSKGEGFSEGFDAHLNIEQMNKTSVELFQLYDDHRKKGIVIPSEKEFRGYYALLKLDKHPGYKVEPAELSLDLAKMTAEMRQTPEILFSRDVARSCRTGNFIAFFRHARKATYLQACLMHAHFSKLRTQALAALHSGLQYGQGVPVAHVSKWLGMEGEDIGSLLEYHGFLIKEFVEPYMVKDSSFLHDDKDYPTRCSILVHSKRSNTVAEDILSSHELISPSKPKRLKKNSENKYATSQHVQTESPLNVSVKKDMEMEAVSPPSGSIQVQPVFNSVSATQAGLLPGSRIGHPANDNQRVSVGSLSSPRVPKDFASLRSHNMQDTPSPLTPHSRSFILGNGQLSDKISPKSSSSHQFVSSPRKFSFGSAKQNEFKGPIQSSPNISMHSDLNATPPPFVSENSRELIPSDFEVTFVSAPSPIDDAFMEKLPVEKITDVQDEVVDDDMGFNFDKEVAEAKLRLLLRLWRRRFVRKKKLYEEHRVAANAALSSLSLGPPLWQRKDQHVHTPTLNIDKVLHERYEKWEDSRVRWNVSDLIAAKLAEKNPNSNCVCWKIISFSWLHRGTHDMGPKSSVTHLSLDEWLRYKLIPPVKDETTEGLAMSAPGLSVWRKWAPTNSGDIACYFSVVKETTSANFEKKLIVASAIVFPISETVPWDVQRTHLHNLAISLPNEACIPLLIISSSSREDILEISSGIVAKLGLEELDKSRVGSYSIISLNEREDNTSRFNGYFSNQKLKDGLMWLASESHPQSILSCATTRDLVLIHLNSCLDALHHLSSVRVSPNQCISAFNEALDQTVKNIVIAAKANPTGGPCPELFLLDESSSEFRAVKQFLPSLGWSSSEEIEPLVSTLRNCKLPYFSDDLSWLGKGCNNEEEIEEQRHLLQDCLIEYLTQTSNVMHWMMAAKEAALMIQSHTRLELCDTEFRMVPNWILILRRVFNWQINSAASFSKKAYVLEQSSLACNPQFLKSDMDDHVRHFSAHPSLDEMVEVSCSPIVSKRVRWSPKSLRNVAARTSVENTAAFTVPNLVFEEENCPAEIQMHSMDDSDIHVAKNDLHLVTKDEKEDDKLIQLLNQCKILQDQNEKKLSIYF